MNEEKDKPLGKSEPPRPREEGENVRPASLDWPGPPPGHVKEQPAEAEEPVEGFNAMVPPEHAGTPAAPGSGLPAGMSFDRPPGLPGSKVELPPDATLEERVIATLKTIFDPEIPVNIYELGLVYELSIDDDGHARIVMTLTSPNCPVAESLPAEVEQKVRQVPGIEAVDLQLTWDPPWSMENLSEAARLTLGMV